MGAREGSPVWLGCRREADGRRGKLVRASGELPRIVLVGDTGCAFIWASVFGDSGDVASDVKKREVSGDRFGLACRAECDSRSAGDKAGSMGNRRCRVSELAAEERSVSISWPGFLAPCVDSGAPVSARVCPAPLHPETV